MHNLTHLPRRTAIGLITLYQSTFSPDHGPLKHLYPYGFCRHEPSCSEYGKQVLAKKGLIIGTALAVKRLLSCTPWHKPSQKKWEEIAQKASATH